MKRVMALQETGEECCMYEGTFDECDTWIRDNIEQYPELTFWIEDVNHWTQQVGG